MSALVLGPALAGLLLTTDPRAAVVAPVVPERHDAGLLLPAPAFDPGRVPFTVSTAEGLVFDFSVFALFLEPGERLGLIADTVLEWREDVAVITSGLDYQWTAPSAPGVYPLRLIDAAGHEMTLNRIVMRAREIADADGINGFILGAYPAEPYRGEMSYLAPQAFIEILPGMEDVALSPHFRLRQFLCKQEGDEVAPRYLVLSERLIVKLEVILEAANARGWRTDGFTVMSGYRTPAYNASLGNGENSRHIYGGAADIFIDTDGDGVMDDLNRDGVLDRQDAALLYDLVESLSEEAGEAWLAGGLGEYGPNAWHGAFVHVDERGWRARWGR